MNDELRQAMELIIAECNKHSENCKECPLYVKNYGCVVEANPYSWGYDNGEE